MSTSKKNEAADRWGGPGSSDQDASKPRPAKKDGPAAGAPTSGRASRVSGGGGRDRHHTHDTEEP